MRDLKILTYDIETNGVNALYADLGFVTIFGYKWLHESKAHTLKISDYPLFKKNIHSDKAILADAIDIMNQADVLIAHFGNKFDRPFLNGRFMLNGLNPPSPDIKQIDTCILSWKKFKFRSNRLKDLAKNFGCTNLKQEKGDGWPNWWHNSMRGDKKAINLMAEYCKRDVLALEEIALKMRPYWPQFLQTDGQICPTCKSEHTQKRGLYNTKTAQFQRHHCQGCGSWFTNKKNLLRQTVNKGNRR